MTLHQLKLLCALAEHRSLTQAGTALLRSQPAVSLQLKELQKELGAVLYERFGHALHLTDAGRSLEQYARRILALVEEAEAAVHAQQEGRGGRIRIGASTTPGIYLLPLILSAFRQTHPTLALTLEVGNTNTITEKLLHNELDLGVVGGTLASEALTVIPWQTDTLVLTVGRGHTWTKRKTIHPKELHTQPILGRERGSATRETYERVFVQHGLALPRTIEMGEGEAIKRAVEAGLGIAIMSASSVAREVQDGRIITLRLKGLPITRPLNIVHHKDKTLTTPLQELLRQLKAKGSGRL